MKLPFNFVSAADGTNVVQIFKDALDLAIDYKKNPPKDDFMAEVMDLLGEEVVAELDGATTAPKEVQKENDDGNDEF